MVIRVAWKGTCSSQIERVLRRYLDGVVLLIRGATDGNQNRTNPVRVEDVLMSRPVHRGEHGAEHLMPGDDIHQ